MLRRKEMRSTAEKATQHRCRLCLGYASEFCSLENCLEDTRTVQEVIKMLLSIEDDPSLPQQICASCRKELLHITRLKNSWVANQFTLARQTSSVVHDKNESNDMIQFQAADQAEEEMYLEVDVNVSDSELVFAKAELGEFSAEEPDNHTNRIEATKGRIENDGGKQTEQQKIGKKYGVTKFRCHRCRIFFPTLKLKNEHIRLHNRCEKCGDTFMMKVDLRMHMRKHNGERPFGCPHCNQRFYRMNHVEEHIKKRHENVKTHACLLCTKNFTDRKELIQHKQEEHSNTRRTQRQEATKEERLPVKGNDSRTIRQSVGDLQRTVVVKEEEEEEEVNEDYELIID